MTERTPEQIEIDTIVAERAGVLAHARRVRATIDRHFAWRRLSEDDAELLRRAIAVFAGDIAIGLHMDGADPSGVGAAMRVLVAEDAK